MKTNSWLCAETWAKEEQHGTSIYLSQWEFGQEISTGVCGAHLKVAGQIHFLPGDLSSDLSLVCAIIAGDGEQLLYQKAH